MPIMFIDSNHYLNLYRVPHGKNLLPALEEQKSHIFVSTQIADEVRRNRLVEAERHLQQKGFAEAEGAWAEVPDLLFETNDAELAGLETHWKKAVNAANKATERLNELVRSTLDRISRSEDMISKKLELLFDRAVPASNDELARARLRKERGNPPGKLKAPLGDQITWEQLLTCVKGSDKLWIVTADTDYGIKQGERLLLNP